MVDILLAESESEGARSAQQAVNPVSPLLKRPLMPKPPDHKDTIPKFPITETRRDKKDQRAYAREIHNAVNLLRGTTEEFKEMANRIYAKPWESGELEY